MTLDGDDVSLASGRHEVWFVPYVDPGPAAPLEDTTWILDSIGEYGADVGSMSAAPSGATFRIRGDSFVAETGVNTISGTVGVSDQDLTLSGVSSSLVGTVGGDDAEPAQQNVLFTHRISWSITGKELRLRTPGIPSTELVYRAP